MSGVSDNALSTLKELLGQQRKELEDQVISGGCKDWADYCSLTGRIKGLNIAQRELLDLNRKIENA